MIHPLQDFGAWGFINIFVNVLDFQSNFCDSFKKFLMKIEKITRIESENQENIFASIDSDASGCTLAISDTSLGQGRGNVYFCHLYIWFRTPAVLDSKLIN